MRVLVVGAGINGLCAAWALRHAGASVAVFDTAPIPNRSGTSYDEHRLIRTPYGGQRGYAVMMAEAWAAWDRLWADLGHDPNGRYVGRVGALALSTSEGDWTDRSAATLDALGLAYERIEAGALPERFPMLRTHDARFGLYDAGGGMLYADRIMDDLAAWLVANGVALHGENEIAAVDPAGGTILVRAGETLAGDAILVTAGVWAPVLFPDLAPLATPLRQVVAYVAPPPALADAWAGAPAMLDLGGPRGMYLAPPAHGRGFKIGVGAYNRPCALDADADPRPEDGAALLAFYRDRFQRWDEFRVLGLRMCRYANEPDQRFILRRSHETWVLTGCSGHGFKFGPLMGEALAGACFGRADSDALIAWAAGETERGAPPLR